MWTEGLSDCLPAVVERDLIMAVVSLLHSAAPGQGNGIGHFTTRGTRISNNRHDTDTWMRNRKEGGMKKFSSSFKLELVFLFLFVFLMESRKGS